MTQADAPELELLDPTPVTPAEYTLAVLQDMRKLGIAKPELVSEFDWAAAIPSRQPSVLDNLTELAQRIEPGDKSIFAPLGPIALQTIARVMLDPNESGKNHLMASFFVLEQIAGKSTQEIKQTGTIIHDVRRQVNEYAAKLVALQSNATSSSPLDKTAQLVDSFMTKHVGENFSVGKRSELSGEESEQQPAEGLSAGDSGEAIAISADQASES